MAAKTIKAVPAEQDIRINAAVNKLLENPAVLERLVKQGIEPQDLSNADFAKLLVSDYVRKVQVVKVPGAKLE